jgi:hypothetical protein
VSMEGRQASAGVVNITDGSRTVRARGPDLPSVFARLEGHVHHLE